VHALIIRILAVNWRILLMHHPCLDLAPPSARTMASTLVSPSSVPIESLVDYLTEKVKQWLLNESMSPLTIRAFLNSHQIQRLDLSSAQMDILRLLSVPMVRDFIYHLHSLSF
jgi:hypothetical protein